MASTGRQCRVGETRSKTVVVEFGDRGGQTVFQPWKFMQQRLMLVVRFRDGRVAGT